MRRHVIVALVGNAEATAEIKMADVVALSDQLLGQFTHQGIGFFKRAELRDLAADVHVNARHINARQFCGPVIDFAGAQIGNAKFVARLASRNLVVCLGIHIGVHANGHGRPLADAIGHG